MSDFAQQWENINHLIMSWNVAQSIQCTHNFLKIHGQIDPIICSWLKRLYFWMDYWTSLYFINQCSSLLFILQVICIWIGRVCFKIVLKLPMQCLKCWPFLWLCIPALQHDVIELQWTIRWLRESIVLTQHLNYLSTCHA